MKMVQKNAIYHDNAQHANFQGKPPFSSYKTTQQQLNGQKNEM